MPYPERVRKIEVEKATNCGICDRPFKEKPEHHSFTSLHLIKNDDRYLVTDPPSGHEILRGRDLDPRVFSPGDMKENDGVCLCKQCHKEVHRMAIAEAKLNDPTFNSKTPPPKLLEEITLFCVNRKKQIVYEVIDGKEVPEKKIVFIFDTLKLDWKNRVSVNLTVGQKIDLILENSN